MGTSCTVACRASKYAIYPALTPPQAWSKQPGQPPCDRNNQTTDNEMQDTHLQVGDTEIIFM